MNPKLSSVIDHYKIFDAVINIITRNLI